MPEGDSIRRVARDVRPLLVDRVLTDVRAGGVRKEGLIGQRVVSVEPTGKHLVITTEDGTAIRTHLGMNGRWWRHPPGHAAPAASLLLATATDTLVCSRAMQVEILARRDPRHGAALARLGPDVLGDTFDPAIAVARARGLPPDTTVARALIDQSVAAGIGNIWRCEALFAERVDPWTPVAKLADDVLANLFARARLLMQQSAPHAVYRRIHQPCPRCGTPIASRLDATEVRRLYFCPQCQK
jgi:endonuclease-8